MKKVKMKRRIRALEARLGTLETHIEANKLGFHHRLKAVEGGPGAASAHRRLDKHDARIEDQDGRINHAHGRITDVRDMAAATYSAGSKSAAERVSEAFRDAADAVGGAAVERSKPAAEVLREAKASIIQTDINDSVEQRLVGIYGEVGAVQAKLAGFDKRLLSAEAGLAHVTNATGDLIAGEPAETGGRVPMPRAGEETGTGEGTPIPDGEVVAVSRETAGLAKLHFNLQSWLKERFSDIAKRFDTIETVIRKDRGR